MIRLREILDPDLREKVRVAIGAWRGMPASMVPEWFELDDADYVDILNAIRDAESGDGLEPPTDPRQ